MAIRTTAGENEQESKLIPGPNGLAETTFPDGVKFESDIPNLMLKPFPWTDSSVFPPVLKRPAAMKRPARNTKTKRAAKDEDEDESEEEDKGDEEVEEEEEAEGKEDDKSDEEVEEEENAESEDDLEGEKTDCPLLEDPSHPVVFFVFP